MKKLTLVCRPTSCNQGVSIGPMVPVDIVQNVPSEEEWIRRVNSSPEEALKCWHHAQVCLSTADSLHSEPLLRDWGVHIGIAGGVLRDLGIDPHPEARP